MKSFKTISFFEAFSIGSLLWAVLFSFILAIYAVLNMIFSDSEMLKFLGYLFRFADNSLGGVEKFFINFGFSSFAAEKMMAATGAVIFLFPALAVSLFFSIYKEIVVDANKNIKLEKRFNAIPVEILTNDVREIKINKTFQIIGRVDLRGELFKEVECIGIIYPIKIETLAGSYKLFIKGEALAELKRELPEINFVEKDLNKNIIGVIFLLVIFGILLVFFKIFNGLKI